MCVCSFFCLVFHSHSRKLSNLFQTCQSNYSHYTLIVHLIWPLITQHWEKSDTSYSIVGPSLVRLLWLMHVPSGTCVLLKEPPINLWALPINANCLHIIRSLNQPHNIRRDKLTELRNDLASFFFTSQKVSKCTCLLKKVREWGGDWVRVGLYHQGVNIKLLRHDGFG